MPLQVQMIVFLLSDCPLAHRPYSLFNQDKNASTCPSAPYNRSLIWAIWTEVLQSGESQSLSKPPALTYHRSCPALERIAFTNKSDELRLTVARFLLSEATTPTWAGGRFNLIGPMLKNDPRHPLQREMGLSGHFLHSSVTATDASRLMRNPCPIKNLIYSHEIDTEITMFFFLVWKWLWAAPAKALLNI